MNRALAAAPIASLAFLLMLMLAAGAVRTGFVTDAAVQLWAGASTAGDGSVSIGTIVAAYPTLPFLSTTLVVLVAPDGTPAPTLVAAVLFALIVGYLFVSYRRAGSSLLAAGFATVAIAFHPAMLRAAIGGPADMFLALGLLAFSRALYALRARSGTSEVMTVGLVMLALSFSHPMGAAIAFATLPFLAFAVPPVLAGTSAFNLVGALTFPTLFGMAAFLYVSWIYPGAGWSFFAGPAEALSNWTAEMARVLGGGPSGWLALDAGLAMGAALMLGAPVAVVGLVQIHRRRPLVDPALVFVATMITATVISVSTGVFGDPAALTVAAPALAAVVMARLPTMRPGRVATILLLALGWFGGAVSLTLIDPAAVEHAAAVITGAGSESAKLDVLGAGGASVGKAGVLADTDNAPAFILGRGSARGLLGPASEPFALALLFARLDTPFVAVPDPQSAAGVNDRLNKAFPDLFRHGAPGYRVIYQNNTWRLFKHYKDESHL